MPQIVLDASKVASRRKAINRFLSPLLPNPRSGGPASRQVSIEDSIIIAAFDGNSSLNYRDWRFRINPKTFVASYFERWIPVDKSQKSWFLERAYLNIYRDNAEYIALHCDPEALAEPGKDRRYKRSLHIHVSSCEPPMSKAHIALAHVYWSKILKSEQSLFSYFREAVVLIRDEILLKL